MTPYIYPGLNGNYISLNVVEREAIRFWQGDPHSKSRKRENVIIRYLVYLVGWKNYGKSLYQLGVMYANKDHATVINGKKKIVEWYNTNKAMRSDINIVLSRVGYREHEIKQLMR